MDRSPLSALDDSCFAPLATVAGRGRRAESAALVVVPWANPTSQSLGLNILKPLLERERLRCEILDCNLAVGAALPSGDILALGEMPIGSVLAGALLDDRANRAAAEKLAPIGRGVLRSDCWESAGAIEGLINKLDDECEAWTIGSISAVGRQQ